MGEPAARKDDPTLHGGKVTSGHPKVIIGGKEAAYVTAGHMCPIHTAGPVASGSDKVMIGGKPAARKTDYCACVPAALTAAEMAASSTLSQGDLANDDDARRKWLLEQALADQKAGASSLEIFSNTVQRSRWANTKTGFFGGEYIDKGAVAKDIGLGFSGYDSVGAFGWDKAWSGDQRNNAYNINHAYTRPGGGRGLPFSGFKEEFRNDDPSTATPGLDDQTHHLGFFTMVGAQEGSIVGKIGSVVSDSDAVNDRILGYEGADLGTRLDDKDLDINAYIWSRMGDPANGPSKKSSDVIIEGFDRVIIGTTASAEAPTTGDADSASRAGSVSNSDSNSNSNSDSSSSSSSDSSSSSSSDSSSSDSSSNSNSNSGDSGSSQ